MSLNKGFRETGGLGGTSRDDWLATVKEDFGEDEDEDGKGLSGKSCWALWTSPVRWCSGTFALCRGLVRSNGGDAPEMERIKILREAVLRTTSALSAPFLHMSAYLVRHHRDQNKTSAPSLFLGSVFCFSLSPQIQKLTNPPPTFIDNAISPTSSPLSFTSISSILSSLTCVRPPSFSLSSHPPNKK